MKACAENGVNYVDISDEFYWQRRMIDGQVLRTPYCCVVLLYWPRRMIDGQVLRTPYCCVVLLYWQRRMIDGQVLHKPCCSARRGVGTGSI